MKNKKTLKELSDALFALPFETCPEGSPERLAAWRDFETAAHAAGAYAEAQRDPADREKEERDTRDENRKIVLYFANVSLALTYSRDTLKALHAAKTFEKREAVIKAIQDAARKKAEDDAAAAAANIQRILAAQKAADEKAVAEARAKEESERRFKENVARIADGLAAKRGNPILAEDPPRNAYVQRHLETFARLFVADRNTLGRPPYWYQFFDSHRTIMSEIGVKRSKKAVEHIRDICRKNGLIPRWNRRKTAKRRKSDV